MTTDTEHREKMARIKAARDKMMATKTEARGLVIGRGGMYGNVLRISPPLNVTTADADQAADVIDAALGEAKA